VNPDGLDPGGEPLPPLEDEQVSSTREKLGDAAGGAFDGLGLIGDVAEGVSGAASAVGDALGSVASGAAEVATGAAEAVGGAVEGLGSVAEGVGAAANGCGSCSLALLLMIASVGATVAAVLR
jgi:hypothetical protein